MKNYKEINPTTKTSKKLVINKAYRRIEHEINKVEEKRNQANEARYKLKQQLEKALNAFLEEQKNLNETQKRHIIRTLSTAVDV
jgi:hypothetical protein